MLALIAGRPIGDEQRPLEEAIERDVHAAVGHLDRRVRREPLREQRAEVAAARSSSKVGVEQRVRHHVELELGDDAEQPVAAHGVAEQIGVLRARAVDDACRRPAAW